MQIVYTVHTGQGQQTIAHGHKVNAIGNAIEHQMQRLPEQAPCASQDDQRNQ